MIDDLPPLVPIEDFWLRQANAQRYSFECAPYGIPTEITANQPDVLEAARLSVQRYSTAAEPAGLAARIQIVVRPGRVVPLPEDLEGLLTYTGLGEWITLSAGAWGYGFANLRMRTAVVVLSPSLATDTRFVSRYFIDHYVLNFALTEWAMLHASCVLDAAGRNLVIMVATHNTGKSTTALRLARAGFRFLADGMAVLKSDPQGFIAGGYPIGEVKLRQDVLAWFPEYTGETVCVREQQKTILNLRAAHPEQVVESLVKPVSIHVCFVERHALSRTDVSEVELPEAARIIAANTAFWNEASQVRHNSAILNHLLQTASLHRLHLGDDADLLVRAFDRLVR